MNLKITLLLFLLYFNVKAQSTFEGKIKFKTLITKTELSTNDFLENYKSTYGDSLIMYYSKSGDFKRIHINAGAFGLKNQFYKSKSGILYLIPRNSFTIDSIDVKENSINKLISKKEAPNEIIMGLDCKCITYTGIEKYNSDEVKITYCYSNSTPKINYSFYTKHQDFFLNDYYKTSERPYLKFLLITPKFSISYTAINMKSEDVSDEMIDMKK